MLRPWWRKADKREEPKTDPAYMRRVVELADIVRRDSDELRDLVAQLRRSLQQESERG